MLERLTIENFRRFKKLEFARLKRVNLIAGKNNTGKTAVLEALLMLLDVNWSNELKTAFRNCANIGNEMENYWKWLFHNHETSSPILFTAETEEYRDYSIAFGVPTTPTPHGYTGWAPRGVLYYSARNPKSKKTVAQVAVSQLTYGVVPLWVRPTDPQKDAIDYDRVVLKAGGEERLEGLLRKIEPRLKSLRSIKPHGVPLIYVDLGMKEKIPAVHFGQGFIRLLSIYSEIIASGKKVLLIDEVENGLHHSVLTEIWRGLLHAAQQEDVQIFATTHSYECIRAAHAAFAETMDYDFALHRLEEVKGEITVTTYDKETLETSLANNFEIR
ncbi:MAG: AAA family ATPase [Gammaproteobacteria bacterium]